MRTPMAWVPVSAPAARTRGPAWTPVVVGVVLVVVGAALVWWWPRSTAGGPAGAALITASSTAVGSSPRNVVDSGLTSSPGSTWQAADQTVGAWIEFTWPQEQELHRVVVVRDPLEEPGVTGGYLSFGDGSFVQVSLSATERTTVVPVTPRSVVRMRFTVSAVSPGTGAASLGEVLVETAAGVGDVATDGAPDGNAAPAATGTVSAGGGDPAGLWDGSGGVTDGGTGADWVVTDPAGAWVQLDWDRPRELSSIAVVGSPRSTAQLAAATVTFDDGTRLPVGAVLPEPARPTVVAFLPRVTRSLRLHIDQVEGSGTLALGELRAYQRGTTPPRTPSPAPRPAPSAVTACQEPGGGASAALVVLCPSNGATVSDTAALRVAVAPGYSSVTATVWPADAAQPAGSPTRTTPDASGTAALDVDTSGLPAGPFTVAIEAAGQGQDVATAYFQLYRDGVAVEGDVPSTAAAVGRTLVYAEEFNGPVSLSRTGLGADYAAAKPVHYGAEDFGEAVFPDPALGFDNMTSVADRYLRIGVEPLPPGFTDPQDWGRTHLGGLLASARQGGSGFSAQYGYFEARMLAPAAPGTWPAFWMLPSDNLIDPTQTVAEIDAIELYGHDPEGGCQSTHEFEDGADNGLGQCGRQFPSTRAALAWHTYGAEVLPDGITFFVDGQPVTTAPQVRGGDAPLFFLVDLALGGGWPVELAGVGDRASLYVDYVRVYV